MPSNNAIDVPIPFTVPFGGTGDITLTNHGVLIGQGASQIAVTSAGTAGQILTSNGASSDPTFQTFSAAMDFSNTGINYADDFLYGGVTPSATPFGTWTITSVANGTYTPCGTSVSGRPGILNLSTGASTNSIGVSSVGQGAFSYILGAGALTITFYFQIQTLSTAGQTYTLFIGLGDTSNGADQVNGCYVTYTNGTNSGKWVLNTANASTRTTSNSTTAVATGWQVLQVAVNAAGNSVSFSAGTTLANLAS